MKKVADVVWMNFPFKCPVCKCSFEADSPADFTLYHDEGEPFLIAHCPECEDSDAYVQLYDSEEKYYMPFVLKHENSAGPRVVRDVKLKKKIRTYCPSCLATFELTTLNGISEQYENYCVECPVCQFSVSLHGVGDASKIIAETLRSFI